MYTIINLVWFIYVLSVTFLCWKSQDLWQINAITEGVGRVCIYGHRNHVISRIQTPIRLNMSGSLTVTYKNIFIYTLTTILNSTIYTFIRNILLRYLILPQTRNLLGQRIAINLPDHL